LGPANIGVTTKLGAGVESIFLLQEDAGRPEEECHDADDGRGVPPDVLDAPAIAFCRRLAPSEPSKLW
jgi:hypothetical protein